jgi:Rrf2 family transcriptional regulator, nitric oxide-sensitive transcriptional repressor
MRLTTYTDYTLRTLMYLAANAERLVTIAELAATYGVSEAHLMKVVHRLGRAGEVETVRGRKGGLRLRKPPDEIGLGAVVRRTEADLELVPCFSDPGTCVLGRVCVLERALAEALAAFLAVLDRYTLADLVVPDHPAVRLLQVGPERLDANA